MDQPGALLNKIVRYVAGYIIGFSVFVFIIPSLLYLLSISGWPVFRIGLVASETMRLIIAFILSIPGLVFVIWSNWYLFWKGRGGPTDIMGIEISPRTERLVTTGPYRYSRNPMVFGAWTTYLAWTIYLDSLGCLLILLLFILFASVYLKRVEESRLLADFGDAYVTYRNRTPMIFPYRRLNPF